MPGAELRSVLKPLRRGLIVVLIVFLFSVTAYAFSSVAQKKWHTRLEKGEYRSAVDEETEEPETTQPNVYVIVSAPSYGWYRIYCVWIWKLIRGWWKHRSSDVWYDYGRDVRRRIQRVVRLYITVDGWLADSEEYGDDPASVWTRIQSGD